MKKPALITAALLSLILAGCGASPTEAEKVEPSATTSVTVDLDETPSESESVTPTPSEGIKTSFKVGDVAKLGNWEVTVTKVSLPSTKQIKKWNEFNESAEGQTVLANYTAKYVGDERTGSVYADLSWKFGGSDNQVYNSSGLVTPLSAAPSEARPGGSLKLDVAFDVPAAAVKRGVVTVEAYTDDFEMVYADFDF